LLLEFRGLSEAKKHKPNKTSHKRPLASKQVEEREKAPSKKAAEDMDE